MKLHDKQFLGLDLPYTHIDKARVLIVPVPYEGGISYGAGTARAPEAVISASYYLELYDEVYQVEAHPIGIATLQPLRLSHEHGQMYETIYHHARELAATGKLIVMIGGDHSITVPQIKAYHEQHGRLSVIQLDAHADLREQYEGSPLSHACVMARIREITAQTLQLGIRSLSAEEAQRVEKEKIALYTMHDMRSGKLDLEQALDALPDPVYLTIDVDAFDWSVIASTGTPEPGGLLWDEALQLLEQIFKKKRVVAFDVVELAASDYDRNSPFAAAKLIYKLLTFHYLFAKKRGN
jgi:agmatinase